MDGNPIEIAAVLVFRVVNSAKAVFDVGMRSLLKFVELDEERKGTMGEKWGPRGAP
ncbi:hypothetical protein Btus_2658 [Kyrpidia tusciae DSM 2912]|uniref:Uncharacterized protein n=1 Tax=Kyrpidia tusciae (strain DSM 2912 / NBRC 15312 / T2) TaxID=562970 RepID=D5WU62_KYRT2|nr:hypothetical protein Btus_2658 [Kyrpidia tusciae DSM 2912]